MKLRKEKLEITDDLEREAIEAVRQLASTAGDTELSPPSSAYFASVSVRTNEAIDRVTSGKALSISWLARVAVPGVVAILFFFIGLHYYVPEKANQSSVSDAVKSLSQEDIDSLAMNATTENSASDQPDLFEVSNDQLAEFYLTSLTPSILLEELSEQQQRDVAVILESRFTNL